MPRFNIRILFKLYMLIALFFLAVLSPAGAEVKIPVVEDVRDIEINSSESYERYTVKATLYGREPLQGEIMLNPGTSINPTGERDRIYRFSDISRITVKGWSKAKKGKGWIFSPCRYEILLKNRTVVAHSENIEHLNRIRFSAVGGKEYFLYTYFYDYYKKGKWVNTGVSGIGTETVTPAAGTLYVMELTK